MPHRCCCTLPWQLSSTRSVSAVMARRLGDSRCGPRGGDSTDLPMIEEGHCKGYVCGVWGLEKNVSTACIALHCIAARWKWATDVLLIVASTVHSPRSAIFQKLATSIQLPRKPSAGPFFPFMISSNSEKLNLPGPPRSLSSSSSMSSAA